MVGDSCTERAARWLAQTALLLRRPARNVAGSTRAAVVISAVILGVLNILYLSLLNLIIILVNVPVLFGILLRNDKILKQTLSASIAVCLVCAPITLGSLVISINLIFPTATLLLHLCLMYCLLAELHGDIPSEEPRSPPEDYSLKHNLSLEGSAPITVHVENTNSPAVMGPSIYTTTGQHLSGSSEA